MSSPSSPPPTGPRVGVDVRSLTQPLTGIGRYTLELLLALRRQGDLDLRGLSPRPLDPDAAALAQQGIPTEVAPAPLGVIWQQLHLPRRLAAGDLDLFWSPLNVLPTRLPVPAVVTVHDLTALTHPDTHRWKVRWTTYPFLQRSLDLARRILTPSHATAETLRFHFPECAPRVRVVGLAAGPQFRPADAATITRLREARGAPHGYWLGVGVIEPRKNIGLLLDAWEALYDDDPGRCLPLLLAGPYGWGSRHLLRRIARLAPAGVRALGRVPDDELVELLQGATAFLFPSQAEGFGLPVVEAMACGVPTLTSDRSSLPEVVGDGGWTLDPGEPRVWAEAMRRIQREPSLAAALGARARAQSELQDWDRAGRRLDGILREAAAG